MRNFGRFTVTLGQTKQIELPGSTSALAALRIYNFTANTLDVVIASASPVIPAQTRDLIVIDPGWQWDGSLTLTPVQDVNISSLSSTVLIIGFGAGETIPGNDPASLIYSVGSQVTLSSYPQTLDNVKEAVVSSSANTQVLTALAPSAPIGVSAWLCRFSINFNVGAGNTNNGTITASVSIDDPMTGLLTQNFVSMTGTALNGVTLNKGSVTAAQSIFLDVSPGTNITINYHNAALGTITDQVSAAIEIVA